MCSLGIEPTTFRSADAMFYHWATQELAPSHAVKNLLSVSKNEPVQTSHFEFFSLIYNNVTCQAWQVCIPLF